MKISLFPDRLALAVAAGAALAFAALATTAFAAGDSAAPAPAQIANAVSEGALSVYCPRPPTITESRSCSWTAACAKAP